jgi:hypothetical protein
MAGETSASRAREFALDQSDAMRYCLSMSIQIHVTRISRPAV